jgi:hypothetical protein
MSASALSGRVLVVEDNPVLASAQKPLDRQQFFALLDELVPLLEKNKFDAISHFNKLQILVAATALAAEFEELDVEMKGLRFDEVLARLRVIAATLGQENTI